MRRFIFLVMLLMVAGFAVQRVAFDGSWGDNPRFNVVRETRAGMEIIFSLKEMLIEEMVIDGESMQGYGFASIYIPQAGAPSLAGATRYVALPQGAHVEVVILDYRTEVYQGVEVMPAPNIPFETDDSPLRYEKDMAIYGKNEYFPSSPVLVSEPMQIRGVDVVIMNVTPFQYNPVTKELVVYKDLRYRLDFVGGNGRFGDDRLRSRFWEPLLQGHLLNYGSLPKVDFHSSERLNGRDGWEYVIIVPDDPVFEAWADTIKAWRKLQGISCEVFTLNEIGGSSATAIEGFLNTAYNTWSTPPAAFLILSDYPSSGDLYGVTSPYYTYYTFTCVSDNKYADVDGDHLPDMHHARICAQGEADLDTMINKFLSYERAPYTTPSFYDEPLMACGWQTERWFQLAVEIIRGYFINVQGKNPNRQYNIYSGTPTVGGPWSTNPNTYMIVNYFGTAGLNYIPDTNPYNSTWWNTGSSAGITNAINAGTFLIQHRDHGGVTGWGEPSYSISNLSSLTNTQYVFVYSTNCLTGKYNAPPPGCFTEHFHRIKYGALGLNSASETSMSFVNDTYIWGMYDCLWPDFMPEYPIMGPGMPIGQPNLLPCMAMTSGKYFLVQSDWPYNPQDKELTCYLFHHHGDAFSILYSEVPQNLTVNHLPVLFVGMPYFEVTANSGAVIALTVDGEIVGRAEATGAPVSIPVPVLVPGQTIKVTITKANYYRYEADVLVTPNDNPYVMVVSDIIDDAVGGNNDGIANPGETIDYGIWAKNVGGDTAFAVYGLLSSTDPYLTINTDSSWYGNLLPDDSVLSNPPYEFTVATDCPDGHVVMFDLDFHDGLDSVWTSHPSVTVYAPVLAYEQYQILDANGVLEPGETVNLAVTLENLGGAAAANVHATIATDDMYLTILTDTASYGDILPDSVGQSLTPYVVQAGGSAPTPHVAQVVMSITGTGYASVDTFGVLIGNIGFYDTVEDTAVTNQYTVQGQWHRTQRRSYSPTYSWWNGTEGTGTYSNNVDASVITPLITLGANSEFECWNWYYLESGYDYGYIELSTDNGVSWSQLTSFNGNSSGWVQYSTALNYPVGTQVKLRFRLDTDYSVVYEGWYVDDIRVFDPLGVSEFSSLVASEVTEFFRIYPNPFRHASAISYQLAQAARVSLSVYDVSGRLVKALSNGNEAQEPGVYTVTWDARDARGRRVPAGVYFVRLDTDQYHRIQKTVLLK